MTLKKITLIAINFLLIFFLVPNYYGRFKSQQKKEKDLSERVWVPDNGDGTYKNPVIFADYSDPDVIRVGNDYYLTSSSFVSTPGLPILHSNDLVNWKIINHAINNLPDERYKSIPQHGDGVWAPSLRYHNGGYWIYYGDPDVGVYLVKTKNIYGKWDEPILVKKAKGWIDPCPLWDSDGNVYLVHAWAKSRAGFNSILTVNRLSKDGTRVLDKGKIVFDGHKNQPTIEGPKFYKHNGYYYIFAPAGGVKLGWQVVLRSKNVYGPYETKIVLAQGNTKINGPHQGGWVETQKGESWFVHFQDRYEYGRVVLLEPMTWKNNWPVMGSDPDGDGTGEPVTVFRKPNVDKKYPIEVPQTSDKFNSDKLGLQWQWEGNHNNKWFSLTQNPGSLRLFTNAKPTGYKNLWQVSDILLQKFPAPEFTVTTKLKLNSQTKGEKAGLIIFGLNYSYIALGKTKSGYDISQVVCKDADKDGGETEIEKVNLQTNNIYFRVVVDEDAQCSFSYSINGKTFNKIGKDFKARAGKWVGAKVGLFSLSPDTAMHNGFADFDWFRVE